MANRSDRDGRDAKGRVNPYIFHLRACVALDSVLPSLAVPLLRKPQKTAIPEGRHPALKGRHPSIFGLIADKSPDQALHLHPAIHSNAGL